VKPPKICPRSGAISRAEPLVVKVTAHKLSGGSRTIGASRVAQIASELEATANAGDLTPAGDLLDKLRSVLDDTQKAFQSRAAEPRNDGNTYERRCHTSR
jgi:HPt (histidine-containing phosphotransfer) domain-containing protein